MIREQVIQSERIVVTTTWLHSAEKVWDEKKGNGLHTYAGPSEFAEFYPVTEEEASSLLGINNSDWHSMIDLDAFYTSVEQRDNPQLRELSVVDGRPEFQEVVAAASG